MDRPDFISRICNLCGDYVNWETHRATATHRMNYFLHEYARKFSFRMIHRDRQNIAIRLSAATPDYHTETNELDGIFTLYVTPQYFRNVGRQVIILLHIDNFRWDPVYVEITLLEPFGSMFRLQTSRLFELSGVHHTSSVINFRLDANFTRLNNFDGDYEVPVAVTIQPKDSPYDYFTIYRKLVVHIGNLEDESESVHQEEVPSEKPATCEMESKKTV